MDIRCSEGEEEGVGLLCSELECESPWNGGMRAEDPIKSRPTVESRRPSASHWPPPNEETIQSLLKREKSHMARSDYIATMQSHIMTVPTRTMLVNWMLEVCKYHQLNPLTAVLAVNYFDRFLSRYPMPEEQWGLHLACIACLSIAAKMEEVEAPQIPDLLELSPVDFGRKCVQRAELHILSTLGWRVRSVTPLSYIGFFCSHSLHLPPFLHSAFTDRCVHILWGTLQDVRMLEFLPSTVAVAIVLCALATGEFGKSEDFEACTPSLCQALSCDMDMVDRCQHVVRQLMVLQQEVDRCPNSNNNNNIGHHSFPPPPSSYASPPTLMCWQGPPPLPTSSPLAPPILPLCPQQCDLSCAEQLPSSLDPPPGPLLHFPPPPSSAPPTCTLSSAQGGGEREQSTAVREYFPLPCAKRRRLNDDTSTSELLALLQGTSALFDEQCTFV